MKHLYLSAIMLGVSSLAAFSADRYLINFECQNPKTLVKADEAFSMTFKVQNMDSKNSGDILSFNIEYTIGDSKPAKVPVALEQPLDSKGTEIKVKGFVSTEIGHDLDAKFSIVDVNGTDLRVVGPSVECPITSAYDAFPRAVVFEEVTATWCPNCPATKASLDQMRDKYGKEGFVTIAYHYNDVYECSHTNVMRNKVSGIPNGFWNFDYGTANQSHQVNPSLAVFEATYLAARAAKSLYGLKLNFDNSSFGSELELDCALSVGFPVEGKQFQAVYILTADNQINSEGGSSYTRYNSIALDGSQFEPVDIDLPETLEPGKEYHFTGVVNLEAVNQNNVIQKDNFRNINAAVILIDKETGLAINAERQPLMGDRWTGIENIAVDAAGTDTDAEPVYYDMQGRRIDGTPAHGLYLRRCGNKVEKVIIR